MLLLVMMMLCNSILLELLLQLEHYQHRSVRTCHAAQVVLLLQCSVNCNAAAVTSTCSVNNTTAAIVAGYCSILASLSLKAATQLINVPLLRGLAERCHNASCKSW
jgi:hypothetical protein